MTQPFSRLPYKLNQIINRSATGVARTITAKQAIIFDSPDLKEKLYPEVGDRDIVGHPYEHNYRYLDRIDCPFPPVRFMPNTPQVMALREKEQNDWKTLTLEDKKSLYRASFRHTLCESQAKTGIWRKILAHYFLIIGASMLMFAGIKMLMMPEMPYYLTVKAKEAQIKRMLKQNMNPITGIASMWDYDKGDWK